MKASDFDFNLPEELIAHHPSVPRDHSRLLVVNRKTKSISHHHFFDLPNFLNPGDLLIANNTRVLPVRLYGQDSSMRKFEVFLLKNINTNRTHWTCLARPGKKIKLGLNIQFDNSVSGFITPGPKEDYEIKFLLPENISFIDWLTKVGHCPLPPYIKRSANEEDKTTYQTIYAKDPGSVAAPTAGLHFTPDLFEKLRSKSIERAELTLHVGYGTFAPIRAENLNAHQMHLEEFFIPEETANAITQTKKNGKRVIAVGTTSLRALESSVLDSKAHKTRLFITPGYELKCVDALITNFHLPQSSLYILISSILGSAFALEAYQTAISQKYRFYSYGDAMLIL